MGFSFIASASGMATGSGTTVATSSALNIAANDVLVCFGAWEDGSITTVSSIDDGGSNAFTLESVQNDGSNFGLMGYITAAAANASATITMTIAEARSYKFLGIVQFRPDSGDAVSKDASAVGNGTGTSMASGAINTSGDDEIVVSAAKNYSSPAFSDHAIGGAAADGYLNIGVYAGIWYRILTSTASSITATATGGNSKWICHIMSIKSVSTGGGLSIPVVQGIYRRRR